MPKQQYKGAKKDLKKRRNKKVYSRRKLLTALVIVFIIILLEFFHYYQTKDIIEIRIIKMNLTVSDYIGFNVDNKSLIFGKTMPESSPQRIIEIRSSEPVRVSVTFKGYLSKWAGVSENNFVFNGTKELAFFVNVPADAEFGSYTGKAVIMFKKV